MLEVRNKKWHTGLSYDIVFIYFHILVLQKYWALTESIISLKPVLGGMRIVALSINSHEQTQLN